MPLTLILKESALVFVLMLVMIFINNITHGLMLPYFFLIPLAYYGRLHVSGLFLRIFIICGCADMLLNNPFPYVTCSVGVVYTGHLILDRFNLYNNAPHFSWIEFTVSTLLIYILKTSLSACSDFSLLYQSFYDALLLIIIYPLCFLFIDKIMR